MYINLSLKSCKYLSLRVTQLGLFHGLFQKYIKMHEEHMTLKIDHTVSIVVFFLNLRGIKCIFTFYSIHLIRLLGLRFLLRYIKKKLFPFSWQHLGRQLASKLRHETSMLHHWTILIS